MPPKKNTASNIITIYNISDNQNFSNLLSELKELNQICYIQKMVNIVRDRKSKLNPSQTTLEKLMILSKYANKLD